MIQFCPRRSDFQNRTEIFFLTLLLIFLLKPWTALSSGCVPTDAGTHSRQSMQHDANSMEMQIMPPLPIQGQSPKKGEEPTKHANNPALFASIFTSQDEMIQDSFPGKTRKLVVSTRVNPMQSIKPPQVIVPPNKASLSNINTSVMIGFLILLFFGLLWIVDVIEQGRFMTENSIFSDPGSYNPFHRQFSLPGDVLKAESQSNFPEALRHLHHAARKRIGRRLNQNQVRCLTSKEISIRFPEIHETARNALGEIALWDDAARFDGQPLDQAIWKHCRNNYQLLVHAMEEEA